MSLGFQLWTTFLGETFFEKKYFLKNAICAMAFYMWHVPHFYDLPVKTGIVVRGGKFRGHRSRTKKPLFDPVKATF
jgi:hypothetical protein